MSRPRWICAVALQLALGFASGVVNAGDDPPDDVKQVFESLRSQWKGGSTDGIAAYFGERVSLALDDKVNGSYSRKQAIPVLRGYFQRTQVEKIEHPKYRDTDGGWSEECKYEYRLSGDSEARKATFYLQIRNIEGRWILANVRVY